MHITYEDLHQYCQSKLGRFRVFVIENHLRGCALCTSRMGEVAKLLSSPQSPLAKIAQAKPSPSPKERRREVRMATDDAAQLQVIAPFSPDRINVRVIDVSKSGLQLRLDGPIAPGSTVKIRLREAVLFAEIRYCRQKPDGTYCAGLLVQEVISGNDVVRVASAAQ